MLGADRMELETELTEALIESHREIGRHAETMDALLERGEDDGVGYARLRVGLAEIGDGGAQVQDFVKGGARRYPRG